MLHFAVRRVRITLRDSVNSEKRLPPQIAQIRRNRPKFGGSRCTERVATPKLLTGVAIKHEYVSVPKPHRASEVVIGEVTEI